VMVRAIRALSLILCLSWAAFPVTAAPHSARISGVVRDSNATPQLGATVLIASEQVRGSATFELLTNDQGRFTTATLLPGLYSIRVSLAGFLPAIEQHIRVEAQQTTLLQIELGTVFSSLEQLRRQPNQAVDADEWSWVLRTSASTRPILRWGDGEVLLDGEASRSEAKRKHAPRGTIELTSGARHPGSITNLADSPATTFAYDQGIGSMGRLVMAGQVSHENSSTAGGLATLWLPSGNPSKGPVTSLLVRESKFGPVGTVFRGLRLEHEDQLSLGDRINVRYGADYLLASLGGNTSALRPRGEITVQLSPLWRAALILSSSPWQDSQSATDNLRAALAQLDAFPTLMLRDGRPLLASDWHQEIAVEHSFGSKASLIASFFRDRSRNTPVYGRGGEGNPDFLQDFFSSEFAYDGGSMSSWGSRVTYQQNFSDNLSATLVYAWGGALTPETLESTGDLRDSLATRYHHSVAARISARVPHLGTKVTSSYKWVDGRLVSRQDSYGESFYQLDPYLNIAFRQPLPSFFPGHMQAVADFGNLLAQGYVTVATRDGQVVLVPSYRYFRGGLSLQF
jgi:hypothetical protein